MARRTLTIKFPIVAQGYDAADLDANIAEYEKWIYTLTGEYPKVKKAPHNIPLYHLADFVWQGCDMQVDFHGAGPEIAFIYLDSMSKKLKDTVKKLARGY